MKIEDFSATVTCVMIISVLCSEANGTCQNEYTITGQDTFIVDKVCDWTVKASDSSAILLLTATLQKYNVLSCHTGDNIEVTEEPKGNTVSTLLRINCSKTTWRVFSTTSRVKVMARGAAIAVNMTLTEYKEQHFFTPHEKSTWLGARNACEKNGGTMITDENYWMAENSPLVKFMFADSVDETWVGKSCFQQYSNTTCFLLKRKEYGGSHSDCSKNHKYICQKDNCGQMFVENKGFFNFTETGKHDCNWTINVGSRVTVNVSAGMTTSLKSCRQHNLTIFTPTTSTADLRPDSLCKTGHIEFSGIGPVFITLTTDSTKSTTVNVAWETNFTEDNTIVTKVLGKDGITSRLPVLNDTTEQPHKAELDQQPDETRVPLYVPVIVIVCVIVAVAVFVAIWQRRKRVKKKVKGKVNEYSYSYTATEIQATNSAPAEQSHTVCKLGEYTEVHNTQLPGSVAIERATGKDVGNPEYNTLHQQLEPVYSHPQENVYNESGEPQSDYGQYDVSSVSALIKKTSTKSQGLTDNVYNTSQSPDEQYGDNDGQYDVSPSSAVNKSSSKKSKGQTDNVYNTFKLPDDTKYSEANLRNRRKEPLPTDNEYDLDKRQT